MNEETNEAKSETNESNPETEGMNGDPLFPDGETPVFVGGTSARLSRTAAFSAENPAANCVTGLPATSAALRIPLFHGRYEIESRPLGAEETRVTVIETRDGARRIIGEVSIKTRAPAPEIAFQDYISCLDLDHSGAVECAEADAAARLVPEMAGPEYGALMAVLPPGSVVRPYIVDEGDGPKTMFLEPIGSVAPVEGFYRMAFHGWIVADLPDGRTYYVGFEVVGKDCLKVVRPAGQAGGRERACKTLREHWTAEDCDAPEVEAREGFVLPGPGKIKWSRPLEAAGEVAEGAAG